MNIVIFGKGLFAELAHYYFFNDTEYNVVGFTVDREYIDRSEFLQLPLVPFDEIEKEFSPHNHRLFVAVGYSCQNRIRSEKCTEAKAKGYQLSSYISSEAVNHAAKIGENSFVFDNAVLQPFVEIGEGVIIWPGTVISHHSKIGDFCYVSPATTISGRVEIGDYVFLGADSVIRDNITLTNNVIVGMGAVVTTDLRQPGVYIGNPAKLASCVNDEIEI